MSIQMAWLNFSAIRRLALIVFGLGAMLAVAPAARAQSCNEDLGGFGQRRNTEIQALNGISKSHGGKLDPIAACPHLRNLKTIEGQMEAYLLKNKDWCNIPDDFINNFKASAAKTGTVANQACALAVKAKEMQKQGAAGFGAAAPPPVKLPAGPL